MSALLISTLVSLLTSYVFWPTKGKLMHLECIFCKKFPSSSFVSSSLKNEEILGIFTKKDVSDDVVSSGY